MAGSSSDRLGMGSGWLLKSGNPFGQAARDARMRKNARNGGRGAFARGGEMKDRIRRGVDDISEEPPQQ